MFAHPEVLQFAYVANILILVPVCAAMLSSHGTSIVFQGAVEESRGLRLLVFSLWLAILVSSIGGLLEPALFAPVIAAQILYKSAWLLLFVMPAATRGERVPTGIAFTFLAIVLAYPALLVLSR